MDGHEPAPAPGRGDEPALSAGAALPGQERRRQILIPLRRRKSAGYRPSDRLFLIGCRLARAAEAKQAVAEVVEVPLPTADDLIGCLREWAPERLRQQAQDGSEGRAPFGRQHQRLQLGRRGQRPQAGWTEIGGARRHMQSLLVDLAEDPLKSAWSAWLLPSASRAKLPRFMARYRFPHRVRDRVRGPQTTAEAVGMVISDRRRRSLFCAGHLMVGTAGFEPATSAFRSSKQQVSGATSFRWPLIRALEQPSRPAFRVSRARPTSARRLRPGLRRTVLWAHDGICSRPVTTER